MQRMLGLLGGACYVVTRLFAFSAAQAQAQDKDAYAAHTTKHAKTHIIASEDILKSDIQTHQNEQQSDQKPELGNSFVDRCW